MLALKRCFRTQVVVRGAFSLGLSAILATVLRAQTALPSADPPFPDTADLVAHVAQDQKKIESLLSQYTFKDKTTVYALDKNGNVRRQHTDTYYILRLPKSSSPSMSAMTARRFLKAMSKSRGKRLRKE